MRSILSWINRTLNSTEWRLSLFSMLFGKEGLMAGSTFLAVWTAYATDTVRQHAPFSLFAVAFCAVGLFYLFYALYAFGRGKLQIIKFRENLYATSGINPLDTYFEKKRIKVFDLAPAVGGAITGKTFVDCEIVGPTNVMFGPTCTFHNNGGDAVDGLILRAEKYPRNGFGFDGCAFRNCRFYLLTFIIPEKFFPVFASYNWSGINWITDLPSTGAPPLIPPTAAPSDSQSPPGTQ